MEFVGEITSSPRPEIRDVSVPVPVPTPAYSGVIPRTIRKTEKPPCGGRDGFKQRSLFCLGGLASDPRIYVGNSTDNGDFNSADLEKVRLAA